MVSAAMVLAQIKQNGIYIALESGLGFEKEDGKSRKSAGAHLGYPCNSPHWQGWTRKDSDLN
jgi:hypothetical protein